MLFARSWWKYSWLEARFPFREPGYSTQPNVWGFRRLSTQAAGFGIRIAHSTNARRPESSGSRAVNLGVDQWRRCNVNQSRHRQKSGACGWSKGHGRAASIFDLLLVADNPGRLRQPGLDWRD